MAPSAKRMKMPEAAADAKGPMPGCSIDDVAAQVCLLTAQRDRDRAAWLEAVEAIKDHAERIGKLEHSDMQYNDQLGMVADHCASSCKAIEAKIQKELFDVRENFKKDLGDHDGNLRAQLDTYASEMTATVLGIEAKLNATINGV